MNEEDTAAAARVGYEAFREFMIRNKPDAASYLPEWEGMDGICRGGQMTFVIAAVDEIVRRAE
jgi:hypothetical protein